MKPGLSAGPAATVDDLRLAQARERLLRTELPRVRSAATAWRNGLGGLLAALVGFSLIRGRTDISELDRSWAVAVGVLLLAALTVGAIGALLLIRAANGRPSVASVHDLPSRGAVDHIEAITSAFALRRGIVLTLTCAVLLVGAVGATWYGPAREQPELLIITPTATICGTVARVDNGRLVLRTATGEIAADLNGTSVVPIGRCPD